jgi:hypothetical protein
MRADELRWQSSDAWSRTTGRKVGSAAQSGPQLDPKSAIVVAASRHEQVTADSERSCENPILFVLLAIPFVACEVWVVLEADRGNWVVWIMTVISVPMLFVPISFLTIVFLVCPGRWLFDLLLIRPIAYLMSLARIDQLIRLMGALFLVLGFHFDLLSS